MPEKSHENVTELTRRLSIIRELNGKSQLTVRNPQEEALFDYNNVRVGVTFVVLFCNCNCYPRYFLLFKNSFFFINEAILSFQRITRSIYFLLKNLELHVIIRTAIHTRKTIFALFNDLKKKPKIVKIFIEITGRFRF